MSWARVWVHMVFSTKNRKPLLVDKTLRTKVFEHILENARKKEIWIESAGGYKEHVHVLISLGKEQTISKVAMLIKGESSRWINANSFTREKFSWQDDYWAVSVSESHVEAVKQYILNQEERHEELTFAEEIEDFMKKYGWKMMRGAG